MHIQYMYSNYVEMPHAEGQEVVSSGNVYSSPEEMSTTIISVNGQSFEIVNWGADNQLPYAIKRLVEKNSVMAQDKFFNTLTCYGRGLEYMDIATMGDKMPKPTTDPAIRQFLLSSSIKRLFAEQIVDIKYYFFSVAVLILDRQRQNIVKVVHKDACHCRFEKADSVGHISHVFYANWENVAQPQHIEKIPLLDEQDPYGDLMARTGKRKDPLGLFHPDKTKICKYAIVCRIPTVGCSYYPVPSYSSVFRDGWYDIYQLLTTAKRAKIRNGQNIRYHLEINNEFWSNRARAQGISEGTPEFVAMKNNFIEECKRYLSGASNSDKMLWSEFDAFVDGKERRMIKVNVVDTSKAGNEYNDDVAEVSNVLAYSDNVHPNLAGATPGKSQMNNSGSDKRELFTMKQSLETMPHDMMMVLHDTIIHYNGWADKVVPVVPMILLTTLDQKIDAKEVNLNNQTADENGNTD